MPEDITNRTTSSSEAVNVGAVAGGVVAGVVVVTIAVVIVGMETAEVWVKGH